MTSATKSIMARVAALMLAACAWCALLAPGAQATPAPPTIGSSWADSVGPTIATLHAYIVPNGSDTVYRFEYGPTTEYGSVAPAQGADVGSGVEQVSVSQPLDGLLAGAAYHYRVVATNSQGTTRSEDRIFSTFGITSFHSSIINADGSPDRQAGSHPYEITADFSFPVNTNAEGEPVPAGSPKDISIELPPGLIGDAQAIPRCPASMLTGAVLGSSHCPGDTQIGLLQLKVTTGEVTLPMYNLIPPAGMPAQFGVFALIFPVTIDASVRAGDGYGLTVSLRNLSQVLPLIGASFTLWGVPADPSHDPYRGSCLEFGGGSLGSCPSEGPLRPFFTLPTACGSTSTIGVHVDAWEQPGDFLNAIPSVEGGTGQPLTLIGCDRLTFEPKIEVRPDGVSADAPIGLMIDVAMGQQDPNALSAASLRDAVVTLPEGVSVNPAVADGLGACPLADVALGDSSPALCPEASKIGTAEIDSSLLADPLVGSIYLAQPDANPFNALLAAYVVVEGDGVLVKLPLELAQDSTTGRLSVKLKDIPELPFTDFKLSLDGGPRAALASANACGVFTTSAQLTPYSAPESGPPAVPSSSFVTNTGCDGGFTPSLQVGSTSVSAGSSTGFVLRLGRNDGQQHIQDLSVTLPRGLLANLAKVPLCSSAEADSDKCDQASRIGTATIASGAGFHPLYLSGSIYLTGPYKGAPFGLAIVVPANVGPLNLGDIVVRAQLSLSPSDLRLTITADPLPQIVDGVPLRLKAVELVIDREGFMFNPTACSLQTVLASVVSSAGSTVSLSDPFRVSGCSGLRFAPQVSAVAQTAASSEGDGAGVKIDVISQAHARSNIHSLSLAFHGQLHPRLTTIQQACVEAVFFANPAACPRGSIVGMATVNTPVLSSELAGPVYIVYRGRKAYPNLMVVLQGDGVSVSLEGVIKISPSGIITTGFSSVPDVPIDAFTIDLPRSPHSILGATRSLCPKAPSVSYTMVGYNGVAAHGSAKVSVKSCKRRRSGKVPVSHPAHSSARRNSKGR